MLWLLFLCLFPLATVVVIHQETSRNTISAVLSTLRQHLDSSRQDASFEGAAPLNLEAIVLLLNTTALENPTHQLEGFWACLRFRISQLFKSTGLGGGES